MSGWFVAWAFGVLLTTSSLSLLIWSQSCKKKKINKKIKLYDNHILQSAYEYSLVHPKAQIKKHTTGSRTHTHKTTTEQTWHVTSFANRDLTGSLRVQYSGHFDCVSMLSFFASCPQTKSIKTQKQKQPLYNKIYVKLSARMASMSNSMLPTLKSWTCIWDGRFSVMIM